MISQKLLYEAVMIGTSAGGLTALKTILPVLPRTFAQTVAVVQHRSNDSTGFFIKFLDDICRLKVKEADDHDFALPGIVYLAPPNYHLLVEDDRSFSLSVDEPVSFARPSIDVLFESAAQVYKNRLIGVILTGANSDGSQGLRAVKDYGGLTIVEDPRTAESPEMPRAALKTAQVDHVLPLADIGPLLCALGAMRI